MIYQSFINSVIVIGLFYGFLTTLSVGPSYLFLIQAWVKKEINSDIKKIKKVAAITGFIMGQLLMFISICYTPLHLALDRPHTMTFLVVPYLSFHYLWSVLNFDGSTTTNSMRNFSIICVFLNNFIFQLLNHSIFTSPMLARLVNISIFQYNNNNKMLFITSSFVGWLIGQILFVKWLGLVSVWIRQNYSIRVWISKNHSISEFIQINKYLVLEFKKRIISILIFTICLFYLGRMPSPILRHRVKSHPKTRAQEREEAAEREKQEEMEAKIKEMEKEKEKEEKKHKKVKKVKKVPNKKLIAEEQRLSLRLSLLQYKYRMMWGKYIYQRVQKVLKNLRIDYKHLIERARQRTEQEEKVSTKKYFVPSIFFKEKLFKKLFINLKLFFKNLILYTEVLFQKLEEDVINKVTKKLYVYPLFDWNLWNRPFRYIPNKSHKTLNSFVRNEMSQYFFKTCKSDGKKRISFTYPLNLSFFINSFKKKTSLPKSKKNWFYTNKQKGESLNNEFINRIEALDKEFIFFNIPESLNIYETKTRFCDDTKEYQSKIFNPFFEKLNRKKKRNKLYLQPQMDLIESEVDDLFNRFDKNRIEFLGDFRNLFDYEFIAKKMRECDIVNIKKKRIWREKGYKFELETLETIELEDPVSPIVIEGATEAINSLSPISIGLNSPIYSIVPEFIESEEELALKKIVPRWEYKLYTEGPINRPYQYNIFLRRAKAVTIYTITRSQEEQDNKGYKRLPPTQLVNLQRYAKESDFGRFQIKGSMLSLRRKMVIFGLFQTSPHSPIFLDRLYKNPFFSLLFSFDISGLIKSILGNWVSKEERVKFVEYTKEDKEEKSKEEIKKIREKAAIYTAYLWGDIPCGEFIRSLMLLIQSFLRRFIILPSFIIAKNVVRIFLLQSPEWSEDFLEWQREMHVICTFNGIPLSETEFPKKWWVDGIQIKIFFPFYLKPWHKKNKKGLLKKQKSDSCFLTVLGKETEIPFGSPRKKQFYFLKFFKLVFKESKKELKNKIGNLKKEKLLHESIKLKKEKLPHESIKLKKEKFPYKWIKLKKEKDYLSINNQIINESLSQIPSTGRTSYLLTEKKIKDLANRTNTILNQIEIISKDKRKALNNLINDNKTKYNARWKTLKRKNTRIIRKLPIFLKFFIEYIYQEIFLSRIFLSIIKIMKSNTELFLKLIKIIPDKYTQEIIKREDKGKITFFSKLLKKISDSKKNLHTFYDLSYVSHAYVFYKLSQIQKSNWLRYFIRQIPLLEKKDFFETREVVNSKLGDNKLPSYKMKQWKNWLRNNYQYNLSKVKWSILIEILNKGHLYKNKKDKLINSKKQKEFEVYSKNNQKENLEKQYRQYRYDLLSYNFLNYEKKAECFLSTSKSTSSFSVNKNDEISTYKKSFDMSRNIPINDDLKNIIEKIETLYEQRMQDRKYLILDSKYLKSLIDLKYNPKVDKHLFINFNTQKDNIQKDNTQKDNIQKDNTQKDNTQKDNTQKDNTQKDNTQKGNTKFKNILNIILNILIKNHKINFYILKKAYEILNLQLRFSDFKIIKSEEFNNGFFDWMGMNEIKPTWMSEGFIKYPPSNLESCFFPELEFLYNVYKSKPWFISTKLLLLNTSMVIENIDENENIDQKEDKFEVLLQYIEYYMKYIFKYVFLSDLWYLFKYVVGVRTTANEENGKSIIICTVLETERLIEEERKKKEEKIQKKEGEIRKISLIQYIDPELTEEELKRKREELELKKKELKKKNEKNIVNIIEQDPNEFTIRGMTWKWTSKKKLIEERKQKVEEEIKKKEEEIRKRKEAVERKKKEIIKKKRIFQNEEDKKRAEEKDKEEEEEERKKKEEEEIKRKEEEEDKNRKPYDSKLSEDLGLLFIQLPILQLKLEENNLTFYKILNYINVANLLLRLLDEEITTDTTEIDRIKNIIISSIDRKELSVDLMALEKDSNGTIVFEDLLNFGLLIIEPTRLSTIQNGQYLMYQTIGVSLKYQEQKENKSCFDLFVPENILSFRSRRKMRILICLNSEHSKHRKHSKHSKHRKHRKHSKHIDREKNQLKKLKLFLWPNYRLEDLACMNRYWFYTNNGSRFNILRLQLYPQLKISS